MRQADQDARRLTDATVAFARALGFHRVGIADARVPLDDDHARYRAFVDAGMHGTMDWLGRDGDDVRRTLDHPGVMPGTRSVVVCAMAYHRDDDDAPDIAGARIARYARGQDYHGFVRKRLRSLASWMRRTVPGSRARPLIDTAPLLERAWARRAGVGFVGKNGMIIAPGLGSYVLLGEVVTTLDLVPDEAMESRCGSCTACLDACPTDAFVKPFVLDARRCISYLTIELDGAMPEPLRHAVGDRLFGCDACQEVCPYNRASPPPSDTTSRFAVDPRRTVRTVAEVAALDATDFAARIGASPLARPERDGLVRNALVVMGNSHDAKHRAQIEALAANEAESPALRETARWALAQLDANGRVGAAENARRLPVTKDEKPSTSG